MPRPAPLAALLLGALNVLAFAPFFWWPIQIVTLAILFSLALAAPSIRHGALWGWAYGCGWLVAGTHWLYTSMHDFGGMPAPMAACAVVLLGLGLGLLPAAAVGLSIWMQQRWQLRRSAMLLLVLPAWWTLAEWSRGWVFTGFPWVSSGYAHGAGPLAGFAPVVGVYGLALLAAVVAGSLALAPRKKPATLIAVGILFAGLALQSVQWTKPSGEPITVRLLQGNVAQEMKFAPEQIDASLALYREMIRAVPADLIVTPETAIPVLSSQLPPGYVDDLVHYVRQSESHLLLGIPIHDGERRYTNSVVGISPSAASTYRYDKHHLVPFGEFIPTGFRWFVDMMRIPLGDFTRGATLQKPFAVKDQYVLPNICYEDLFGEEIAAQIAAGKVADNPAATILLNVSNIAWFGDSIALPQHLQISRMRTLETGRPMLRATNTGVTAVIDAHGEIVAQLAPYTRATLEATVQGHEGFTPYIIYGNKPAIALSGLMLLCAFFLSRKGKQGHGLSP